MKKGDKVRFLSEVGGGMVAGFQGKNIVLVEDEDGFEIPMPINEVVVVEQDDYAMGKMISAKMDAKQRAEEHANTELHQDSRSIKAILNEHETDVDMNVEEYDAADREITFVKQVQERTGGNKLSAYLAFVPIDIKDVTNTRFESYMVNDSNYYLRYTYLVAEGNAWTLKAEGEIEPNTKLFIEEFGREALNEMEHIAIQLIAYKKDKPFLLKPATDVQFRLDPVKFYKLHLFEENDFFETPAYLFTIVENDEVARPLVIDSKRLKEQMYKDEKVIANTSKKKSKKDDGTLVIDLHADEVLETTAGMNSADILHYQMDIFKKTMAENKKNKGQKIIFIHGKGEGVLRQVLNINSEHLRNLNPQYRRDIIYGNRKPMPVRLPVSLIGAFIDKEDSIYNYKADEYLAKRDVVEVNDDEPSYTRNRSSRSRSSVSSTSNSRNKKSGRNNRSKKDRKDRKTSSKKKGDKSVTIRKGDTLSEIAARNGTTVKKLRKLNKISGNSIRAGKKLKVK